MYRRALGNTGLSVTPICIGTSPLSSMPSVYGYSVDAEQARDAVRAALEGPFNFLDTSNNYGGGTAETLIGEVLAEWGGLPQGVVLATKVDADPITREFSGDRVRRSVEESAQRLGLSSFHILHLHDPEFHVDFSTAMAPGGVVETLQNIKAEGGAGAIGIATGNLVELRRYLDTGVFDVLLSHNRYTLLDRTADDLITACNVAKVPFLNAAPFGGGILVKGPGNTTRYAYAEAEARILSIAHEMEAICKRHNVPLAAAALQFSLRDARIAATVVGVSARKRVGELQVLAGHDIPQVLWDELDALSVREGIARG
jgi:D-threo-aldose 1-dehydrogenase